MHRPCPMSEAAKASDKSPAPRTSASGRESKGTDRARGGAEAVLALQHSAGNHAVAGLLRSSGHGLDAGTRENMEQRFGADFRDVRIHRGQAASGAALAAGARAITHGRDILFGPGYYDPRTADGKRLLAHELAHVIQQSRKGQGTAAAAAESEARAAASGIVAGKAVAVAIAAGGGGAQCDPMTEQEKQRLRAGAPPPVSLNTLRALGLPVPAPQPKPHAPSKPEPPATPAAPNVGTKTADIGKALPAEALKSDEPDPWAEFKAKIRPRLIEGEFAFSGDYDADTDTGAFKTFRKAELNEALRYYRDVWPTLLPKTAGLSKEAQAMLKYTVDQQKKKQAVEEEHRRNREKKADLAEANAVVTLESDIQRREESRDRINRNYDKLTDRAKTAGERERLQRARVRDLANLPKIREQDPEIYERMRAKQLDAAEGGASNMELYRAGKEDRDKRRAIYKLILARKWELAHRRFELEKKEKEDPTSITAAEKSALEDEEFQVKVLLVHLSGELHREDTREVQADREFVAKKLESEKTSGAAQAPADTTETPGTAAAPSTKDEHWRKLQEETTKTPAADLFQKMSKEQALRMNRPGGGGGLPGVYTGDTEGVFVTEHPQWFRDILNLLIARAPAGSRMPSAAGGSAWDEDASGAQALIHSYLNAWAKRRIAAQSPGEDEKDVAVPSNDEVLDAAVGYSVTNDRARILGGFKGGQAWCAPAAYRALVLGLWKSGLYLKTARSNMEEISEIGKQLKAGGKAVTRANVLNRIGALVNLELNREVSFFFNVWPAADYSDWGGTLAYASAKTKPAPSNADKTHANRFENKHKETLRQRFLGLPAAADAPLLPGDIVTWVSNTVFGPISGHVATIIEEKDRNQGAKNANDFLSHLRVDSGNAGGAIAHEGSVRPEGVNRLVTDRNLRYGEIVGPANSYFYDARGKYDKLAARAGSLSSEDQKTMDDLKGRILKLKSESPYPVHKTPEPGSAADALPGNKWDSMKDRIVPNQKDSVWIINILRGSQLDAHKLIASATTGEGKLDAAKLASMGVLTMPEGLLEIIRTYFTEVLGERTLLATDKKTSAEKAQADRSAAEKTPAK